WRRSSRADAIVTFSHAKEASGEARQDRQRGPRSPRAETALRARHHTSELPEFLGLSLPDFSRRCDEGVQLETYPCRPFTSLPLQSACASRMHAPNAWCRICSNSDGLRRPRRPPKNLLAVLVPLASFREPSIAA